MLIGKKLISSLDNDLIFLQMHEKSNNEKVAFQLPVNFIYYHLENKAKSNYFYTELCHETVLAVTVSNRPHFDDESWQIITLAISNWKQCRRYKLWNIVGVHVARFARPNQPRTFDASR